MGVKEGLSSSARERDLGPSVGLAGEEIGILVGSSWASRLGVGSIMGGMAYVDHISIHAHIGTNEVQLKSHCWPKGLLSNTCGA